MSSKHQVQKNFRYYFSFGLEVDTAGFPSFQTPGKYSLPSPSTRPCRLSIPVLLSLPGWPGGYAAAAVSTRHCHGLPRCQTAFCLSARWRTPVHIGKGAVKKCFTAPDLGYFYRLQIPLFYIAKLNPGRAVHRTAPTAIDVNRTIAIQSDDNNAVGAPRCCARIMSGLHGTRRLLLVTSVARSVMAFDLTLTTLQSNNPRSNDFPTCGIGCRR